MIKKTGVRILLSLVFVLFTYSFAFAQTPEVNFKKDNVYGSINAGAIFINDVGFSGDLSFGSILTVTVAGEATSDTGHSVGGTIGYILNNHVRTEFELAHTQADIDKINMDLAWTFTSGGTTLAGGTDVAIDVDGETDALFGLANIIFTPFATDTTEDGTFTPLIGGGIGFVDWETKINSLTSGGTTLTVNSKEDGTDFLAAIIAGLEYNHSNNIALAFKYHHYWANTGQNGVDDVEADSVVGSLRFRF